ncbi:MAG: hypothetical protein GX366_03330 [Epulopiscium sp.]|nr:hypothetical protein [Candidatus Epulonipiscium sp.]
MDHELIINKRVGLTKCNEIYILMPDIESPKDKDNNPPEKLKSKPGERKNQTDIKTNTNKTNYTKTNFIPSFYPEVRDEEEDRLSQGLQL